MISDVAESLHTFFVPQLEQLGLKEQPARYGSLSAVDAEWGSGVLWAHSIGENCLYTFHDLHLDEPVRLAEFPDDYVCIASMTSSSARLCSIQPRCLREQNTVSFKQDADSMSFTMNPGERHRSYSLCMTPKFFDELAGVSDEQKELLVDYLCSNDTNMHPRSVGIALESMNPSWAIRPGGNIFCQGKVGEILAYVLDAATNQKRTGFWHERSGDQDIARKAQTIIDERFAENLTLQSIAAELYVGKTKLCKAFRTQIGSCVAEYLHGRRMIEAERLLETTAMKTSEIAAAVGYAHANSFTDAFKREFGMSPSQWRERAQAR